MIAGSSMIAMCRRKPRTTKKPTMKIISIISPDNPKVLMFCLVYNYFIILIISPSWRRTPAHFVRVLLRKSNSPMLRDCGLWHIKNLRILNAMWGNLLCTPYRATGEIIRNLITIDMYFYS